MVTLAFRSHGRIALYRARKEEEEGYLICMSSANRIRRELTPRGHDLVDLPLMAQDIDTGKYVPVCPVSRVHSHFFSRA